MGKKKTKSTTTTTPTVTEPYNTAFQGFTGQIGDFLEMDPTQFVAPESELQTQAFQQAQNLGGWQPYLEQASSLANQAASAPASQVTAHGYEAPNIPGAWTLGGTQLDPASQYGGTQLGDPARLKDYMADYQNPYTQQVIDAALADFDEYAGTQRAGLAAGAGATGAFGGSRYGIAEGQLEGELARGRASTEASLLDQQYRLAAQLAGVDAGAANQYGLQQGAFDQQTGLANTDALNQFAMQQGLLNQQTDVTNQAALNNFLMTQMGMDADEARYYADALNQSEFQNANLLEQSYLRDLQASGQLGDLAQLYGQQSLADTGLTAQLGEMQRGITSAELNALPTQLQIAGNLYSQLYPGLYSGQTGVTTGKQSGGLLGQLAGSAMQAGAIAFG